MSKPLRRYIKTMDAMDCIHVQRGIIVSFVVGITRPTTAANVEPMIFTKGISKHY